MTTNKLFQHLWRSFSLRPFLALACATGCGAAWGAARGASVSVQLHNAWLAVPAVPAVWLVVCVVAALAIRATAHSAAPLGIALVIGVLFFCLARSRQLPPSGDISSLVRGGVPAGPQQPLPIEAEGTVLGAPRRSDFGQEFPFFIHQTRFDGVRSKSTVLANISGCVWVRAPRTLELRENDVLTLRGELTDLPRAGNAGERQLRARYIAAHCWALLRVRDEDAQILARDERGLPAHLATWRRTLQQRYERAFRNRNYSYSATTAALLSAMILGDRAGEPLPRATRDAFRASGLTHLLVASGTQVALLCALMLGFGRALHLRGIALFGSTLLVLVFYALLTGGAASIWRAAIAGGCIAFAAALGRPADRVSLLSLAFVVLLCLDTAQIQDIGFQLTFAATWGLAVLAPALVKRLRSLRTNALLAEFCGATLGAQLATLPLLLYHFGRAGAHGFAANALALPLAALLVGCGLLGLVFAPLNALNYVLVTSIGGIAQAVAAWPGARTQMVPLSLAPTLLLCAVLLLMSFDFSQWRDIARYEFKRWRWREMVRGAAALGLIFLTLATWRYVASTREDAVRVTLLDVGQGESILLTQRDRAILIDGGSSASEGRGDVGASVIVPFLQSRGVRRLNAIVITHADADHCNALKTVLREVPTDLVVDGAAAQPTSALTGEADYLALREEIRRRGIPVVAAAAGQRLNLGDAQLDFLAPLSPPLASGNDNSAVAMLRHGAVRVLFTGDIERAAEERLARRADLRCDVLKVAHHGSKTSTGEAFLRAARPRYAMLSCGRYNSFGHPAASTLSRFARAGVRTYRTDRDGAITLVSDGRTCRIEAFR